MHAAIESFSPLCDLHFFPMSTKDFDGERGYACLEPGCTRCYSSTLGLFDLDHEGRILREKFQQLCPRDRTFMYLDSVEPGGIQTWRCARVSCNQSQKLKSRAAN